MNSKTVINWGQKINERGVNIFLFVGVHFYFWCIPHMTVPQQSLSAEHEDPSFLKSKSDTKTHQKSLDGCIPLGLHFQRRLLVMVEHFRERQEPVYATLGSWLQTTEMDTGKLKKERAL